MAPIGTVAASAYRALERENVRLRGEVEMLRADLSFAYGIRPQREPYFMLLVRERYRFSDQQAAMFSALWNNRDGYLSQKDSLVVIHTTAKRKQASKVLEVVVSQIRAKMRMADGQHDQPVIFQKHYGYRLSETALASLNILFKESQNNETLSPQRSHSQGEGNPHLVPGAGQQDADLRAGAQG